MDCRELESVLVVSLPLLVLLGFDVGLQSQFRKEETGVFEGVGVGRKLSEVFQSVAGVFVSLAKVVLVVGLQHPPDQATGLPSTLRTLALGNGGGELSPGHRGFLGNGTADSAELGSDGPNCW